MWWRRKQAKTAQTGPLEPAADVLRTADEFESADKLDNDAAADTVGVPAMELALERLRGRHLAFRRPNREDESSLEELRLRILEAVTGSGELESYYREAWGQAPEAARVSAMTGGPATPHRRVAVMQIELMLRAFYVLQLQLFANARENRGWMTLFRNWGRSHRFNQIFDEVAATLPPEFTKFYSLYLRDLPARASASGHLPIHHPWLKPPYARGRGLYMDSGRMEAEVDVRPGTAGQTDQRGGEGADQGFERPSDSGESGGGPTPAPNE